MRITGNINGLNKTILQEINNLYNDQIQEDVIIEEELAKKLANLTARIGREIAVYVNRRGQILAIGIGDDHTVALEEINLRRGEDRLSGVRCIHTHPSGNGMLSDVDIAASQLLKFDAMVAIGVDVDGNVASIGFAWGEVLGSEPKIYLYPDISSIPNHHFSQCIQQYEKNIADGGIKSTAIQQEKAILVSVQLKERKDLWDIRMSELEELAHTAGLVVLQKVIQRKVKPEAGTFIGRGKMAELRLLAQVEKADVIVFDQDLSPSQQFNLENGTGCKIIDRSMLILDIFAQRARSNEGKLQVELAQLRYMLPRLMGQGTVLSRLGGGIGTRGPGETKLETDRRHIRRKINELENQLENVMRTRSLHRKQRKENEVPIIALIGYTNAGKSSLMKSLTGADVFIENQLFATLDTISRQLVLPKGKKVLLSDTVGFIGNLPHHLIAAFRATLEELQEADVLLHVIDGSNPYAEEQIEASIRVLRELNLLDKSLLTVINKMDQIEYPETIERFLLQYDPAVAISAKMKIGLEQLLEKIETILDGEKYMASIKIPFADGKSLAILKREGQIIEEQYKEDGMMIKAVLPVAVWNYFLKEGYLLKKENI